MPQNDEHPKQDAKFKSTFESVTELIRAPHKAGGVLGLIDNTSGYSWGEILEILS